MVIVMLLLAAALSPLCFLYAAPRRSRSAPAANSRLRDVARIS